MLSGLFMISTPPLYFIGTGSWAHGICTAFRDFGCLWVNINLSFSDNYKNVMNVAIHCQPNFDFEVAFFCYVGGYETNILRIR